MKRGLILGIFVSLMFMGLVSVLSSFVSAGFSIGNLSHEIDTSYGPNEILRGWFNISLDNEPSDSLLTGFGDSVNLFDFLKANNLDDNDYSCIPEDCDKGYSVKGTGASFKTIIEINPTEWLIGLKLNHGDSIITAINSFDFEVSTSTSESCINPIKIDIGDNGDFEWIANEVSDNVCGSSGSYGCFNGTSITETLIRNISFFCEQITLFPFKSFRIGAIINGSGSAEFKMTLEVGDDEKECQILTNVSGEVSCDVNLTTELTETTMAEVCIGKVSGADYKIRFEEDANECGYVTDSEGYMQANTEQDFEIFAKPKKYAAVNDFTFNQELVGAYASSIDEEIILKDKIWEHIDNNYNHGDCSNDCIIPIRFYFGTTQQTTVFDLNLDYDISGRAADLYSTVYELEESSVILNSGFLKLDLEKANLSAPTDFGTEDLVLRLSGGEIFSQEISVKAIPQIVDLIPKSIPALVNFPISVILGGAATNLTFKWNFGDGKSETTYSNTVKHSYLTTGPYIITVNITNRFGSLSRSFPIIVGSPKDYINETITNYRADISSVQASINQLPAWIKIEIEKKAGLEDLKTSINSLEIRYDDAFETEEYVKVMKDLLDLNVPSELDISQTINPVDFFPNEEQFDLETLEILGAGNAKETREIYSNAANNWIRMNLGILLESETYSFYFNGMEEAVFSYFKIILEPVGRLDEFYLVVNGNPDEITFSGDLGPKDVGEVAKGVTFVDLNEKKTIEFLYPGKVDVTNFPIFISPEFKNLETGVIPGPCNNNGICESGENYKNCRKDCKPIGWTVFWFILLFVIAFIIYIVLQEWYKRHYEAKLFPNKSQLFNLVNFMSISLNQGVKISDIKNKLKDLGWDNEQLNYVANKLHGKRVGMWEIPVLKWVENRQVKKELAKRQGTPVEKGLSSK